MFFSHVITNEDFIGFEYFSFSDFHCEVMMDCNSGIHGTARETLKDGKNLVYSIYLVTIDVGNLKATVNTLYLLQDDLIIQTN